MQIAEKKSHIMATLENLKNLPAIPKIIFEVADLLKVEPVNNIKLAQTIGKDQSLTTKVLSVANSPLYGLQRKVASLEFAILILGAEEIGSLVTAISLSDRIKFDQAIHFTYWKHSMIVGTASRDIARRLNMSDIAGDAFIAGMLHDLGIQLIVKYFPNEYEKINILANDGGHRFVEAEYDVLGCTHQEVGKFLAQKWDLPKGLCDALENHHRPLENKENQQLTSIIHLADCMTHEFKIGDTFWDGDAVFETEISDILGFESLEELAGFTSDYKEIFKDAAESIKL